MAGSSVDAFFQNQFKTGQINSNQHIYTTCSDKYYVNPTYIISFINILFSYGT